MRGTATTRRRRTSTRGELRLLSRVGRGKHVIIPRPLDENRGETTCVGNAPVEPHSSTQLSSELSSRYGDSLPCVARRYEVRTPARRATASADVSRTRRSARRRSLRETHWCGPGRCTSWRKPMWRSAGPRRRISSRMRSGVARGCAIAALCKVVRSAVSSTHLGRGRAGAEKRLVVPWRTRGA